MFFLKFGTGNQAKGKEMCDETRYHYIVVSTTCNVPLKGLKKFYDYDEAIEQAKRYAESNKDREYVVFKTVATVEQEMPARPQVVVKRLAY